MNENLQCLRRALAAFLAKSWERTIILDTSILNFVTLNLPKFDIVLQNYERF